MPPSIQRRIAPAARSLSTAFARAAAALRGGARWLGPRLAAAASRIRSAATAAVGSLRAHLARLAATPSHRSGRQRSSSLVYNILTLQLLITGVIGVFALAGLAWTTQSITNESLARWAHQWTDQVNELGAPLYLSDPDALVNVENFLASYSEVGQVDWYGPSGERLLSVSQDDYVSETATDRLDPETIALLTARAGDERPELLDDSRAAAGHYRMLSAVATESLVSDALIDDLPGAETALQIRGFLVVEIDYASYEEVPNKWLAVGSLMLILALALSWGIGLFLLKRALEPLSGLQQPLSELARGNMRVEFAPSQHVEIQNIINALGRTTRALGERDRRLSHLATHDSLTGLLNRHAFVQELEREIARLAGTGKQSAILFIDLDQFKYINDTCGHPAGDELLRIAARSIRAMTRDEDFVARFGGDEFAVLACNVTRAEARTIGDKILQQMGLLTQVHENKVFHLQCSIGITMVRHSALDAHEFLSQADIACHAAKDGGRNRLEIYKASRKENQQMTNELVWVQKIKTALAEDDFMLVYQPLLRISTGWTDHYEVLLRLKVDDHLVSPDVFLPAAMRFGLMVDIDHWVLENAIRSLAEHRTPRSNLNFSINLSASVFENDRFGRRVESLLGQYSVPPESIIFEITEQTAVRFAAESDKQIALLRAVGCRFAIDDFGKGYSSFSYLRDLPVDYLKIDGSFVENLEHDEMNQTLVRVMGEIARAARIETIAECVQSAATLELLAHFGIDYAQGHYIAHPSPEPTELELQLPRPAKAADSEAKRA